MTLEVGQVHVKRQRGVLVVQGMGQTPRGQKYVKKTVEIDAGKVTDKDFKGKQAAAVAELFESEEPAPQ